MPIHFDPNISNISSIHDSDCLQKSFSQGLSEIPSSISWRMSANASEGGICSWITDFIHRICQLLGLVSSDTVIETPLESRIAEGKRILDSHFQQNFITRVNSPDPATNADSYYSAIIVVMKYNGQYKVGYGRAQSMSIDIDVLKAQLRELLTREESGHNDNSMLEVETLLFRKHITTFDFFHIDSRLRFSDGSRGGGPGHGNNLGRAAVFNQICRAIPAGADQQRIVDFVINQL
jgi:hypothetical protein